MKAVTKLRVRVWGALFYANISYSKFGVEQYRLSVIEGSTSTICWGRTTFLAHESCGRFYGDFLDALPLAERVQEKKLVPSPIALRMRELAVRVRMLEQEAWKRNRARFVKRPVALPAIDH